MISLFAIEQRKYIVTCLDLGSNESATFNTMPSELSERLGRVARNNEARYTTFLQKLLQIPTPRMQEHQCLLFLAEALEASGIGVMTFEGFGMAEPLPDGPPLNL